MPCASKLQAAQALARTMGLNASQVMCLGDTTTTEMIRWAGIGVAMGNAEKGVKADADYVAKDNNEHGFAQAVGEICTVKEGNTNGDQIDSDGSGRYVFVRFLSGEREEYQGC